MILDGNRRFARQLGLKNVTDGHRFGASKVTEVIRWCDQLGIDTVTLWGLSTDNFKRPPEELNELFAILQEQLRKLRTDNGGAGRRRVRVLGRLEMLPAGVQDDLHRLEEETAADGPRALNIALAYGGRDEIVDAFRNMLVDRAARGETLGQIAESIRPEHLRPFLYAGPESPDPDLIIRTSGEVRLSGFLLWQSTNSELYFCDPYWPAFRKIDLLRAIRSYQQRQRRFGR
jgi:short-chain Z-isoprenyl diphosphate synthase